MAAFDIVLYGGCLKTAELIQRIYIRRNSDLFGTNKLKDTFVQRFSTKAFMESLIAVNKEDYVKSEMLKALNTLKVGKRYNAISHAMTKRGLEKLQRDKIIQNLTKTQIGERSFLFEKVMIGNIGEFGKKIKHLN